MRAEGEDLPVDENAPAVTAHLLLESSQELSALIWKGLNPRLALCTSNVDTSMVLRAYEDDVEVRGLIGLLGMINAHYFGGESGFGGYDDEARFMDLLALVREENNLRSDEDVVMVHGGSHTTLAPTIDTYVNEDVGMIDDRGFAELLRRRINRTTCGIVYEMLRNTTGVKVEWLVNVIRGKRAFEKMRPKGRPTDRDLDIAGRARATLDGKRVLHFGDGNHALPLASIPYIYYEDTDDQNRLKEYRGRRYRRSGEMRFGDAFTSTDRLLRDFRESRKFKNAKDPVLVKLAPTKLALANPMDAPVVRDRHLRAAALAGITRILLDDKVGIIDTTATLKPEELAGWTPPSIIAV